MKNKHAGFLIIGIAVLMGFLIWLFNNTLTKIVNASCSHGASCPMWSSIRFQTMVGISILTFVCIIGLYFVFYAKDGGVIKEIHKLKIIREGIAFGKIDNKKRETVIKSLSDDERKVYNLVSDAHGSIFQSVLVKDTEYSKVKITRLLDRLEGRGLIERKRRGMTNIIILKY